jgi:hypothetical protein
VSAIGQTIPVYMVLKGRRRMDAYFSDNLEEDTVIDMSDSGYSNDQIGVRWLQHFI